MTFCQVFEVIVDKFKMIFFKKKSTIERDAAQEEISNIKIKN